MSDNVLSYLHAVLQGDTLSMNDSQAFFNAVVSGNVDDIVLASMLTALKQRGETPEEVAGAAAAMIASAAPIARPAYQFADIVGTGGDGHNTINISSAAAIVAASCGLTVAKHGNRSVSSKSGSADLFEQFGLNLTMPADVARQCLDEAKFCFLFAPNYHAGIKHAMNVRTTLKTRTLFNLLGPLVNPARPSHILTGVYAPELVLPYAKTLQLLGYKHAMVVHGSGLDEIGLHGSTQVAEIKDGNIIQYEISPADFGLPTYTLEDIKGGEPEENRAMIKAVLQGQGESAHRDNIAANAGALLKLCGLANTLEEGAKMAITAMNTGSPLETIQQAARISQEATKSTNSSNILEKIVTDKRQELVNRKQTLPLEQFIGALKPSTRSFYQALAKPNASYILECKKASPSKGLIREKFDLDEILDAYLPHASAISVLTDEKYFQGKFEYLDYVTSKVDIPVLNKDFFVDPYQIHLARYHNADAVLLMLSVLSDEEYKELADLAHRYDMDVLTEVSNIEETQRAIALGAKIVGINNRNLRDLSTDLAMTEKLAPLLSTPAHADKLVISESGIYTNQDVRRLAPLVDGFLVGSSLMAQENVKQAAAELTHGRVKVCGITREQDALAAKSAGASYLGVIFAPKSKRNIELSQAKDIVEACPHNYVGVFVDANIAQVVEASQSLGLAAVQLHGNEDQAYINSLREQLPQTCQIWKAKGVTDSLPSLNEENVDVFLLDCQVGTQSGGTGKQFNWRLLDSLTNKTNIALAGGLKACNVAAAASHGVAIIDINSGVESAPGIKDAALIQRAFTALREY